MSDSSDSELDNRRVADSDDESNSSSSSSEDEAPRKKKRLRIGGKAKKKKKAKPARNIFFEEEADVNEEESDEGDYEEPGLHEVEDTETRKKLEARQKTRDRFLEKSAEELALEIEERHRGSAKTASDWANHEVTSREANLPTVTDPRLYLVKCKPGEEKNMVVRLMQKFLVLQGKPDCPKILSVSSPGIKGYIYVEAKNEAHVKQAITGLRDVYPSRTSMVPINEMTDAMTITVSKAQIKAGDLVRLRRFPYKGDIARVVRVADSGDKVVIECVPRLDFQAFRMTPDERKERRSRKIRPPKKFFNLDEVTAAGGNPDHKHREGQTEFEGNTYRNGFLHKEMSIRQVQVQDVDPSLEELQLMTQNNQHEDESSRVFEDGKLMDQVGALKSSSSNLGPTSHLAKRDLVRVKEGDLQHLRGKILAINGASGMVKLELTHEEVRGKQIELPAAQLMKYFQVGDHVKVIGGIYAGQTGSVVKVNEFPDSTKEWVAVVFTDAGKEIQVLFRDLRVSEEVSVGQDSLGGYKMYDQVWLMGGQTGVITAVGNEDFEMIMQNGEVRRLRLAEIRSKRLGRDDSALDRDNNPLRCNDVVKVVSGANSNFEGTIKHMFRSFLFLHSRMYTKNAGIFVEKARNVVLSGVKFRAKDTGLGKSRGRGGFRGGRRGGRAGRGGHSDLKGKTVKIKGGRYKGYIGIVVNATEEIARVEIHSKNKQVKISRDKVAIIGDASGAIRSNRNTYQQRVSNPYHHNSNATPLHGSATPLHGSATPLHGSATPLHGSATPTHEPATPGASNDAWNASVSQSQMPETPAAQDGAWAPRNNDYSSNYIPPTPAFIPPQNTNTGSSYDYSSGMPATPAGIPATPNMPATPAGIPATPANDFSNNTSGFKAGDRIKVTEGKMSGKVGEVVDVTGADAIIDFAGDVQIVKATALTQA